MKQFITKYADKIKGVLSGFDRLVFRGSMRSFNYDAGRKFYLCIEKLPYKDFVAHAQKVTERVKITSLASIRAEGRPVVYLASSKKSKEETAKRIATENQITKGTSASSRLSSLASDSMSSAIKRRMAWKLFHALENAFTIITSGFIPFSDL